MQSINRYYIPATPAAAIARYSHKPITNHPEFPAGLFVHCSPSEPEWLNEFIRKALLL